MVNAHSDISKVVVNKGEMVNIISEQSVEINDDSECKENTNSPNGVSNHNDEVCNGVDNINGDHCNGCDKDDIDEENIDVDGDGGGDDDDDDDSESGWITPGNIQKVKQSFGTAEEIKIEDGNVKCACLTTDFAMQVKYNFYIILFACLELLLNGGLFCPP